MSSPASTLLVISRNGSEAGKNFRRECKVVSSSLLRSLFGGRVVVFHDDMQPLFRIERKQMEEPMPLAEGEEASLLERVKPYLTEARQWVVFSGSGNIALRNIDHLLPPDIPGPFAPEEVDFYFPGKWGKPGPCSDGLWAVRAEFLEDVLGGWEAVSGGLVKGASRADAWREYVGGLDLRKKPFESGEVVAPEMGAVDWREVADAAFVLLTHWPEEKRWKFLQSLYFGTYFGDDSGLMLDILDP